jgi:hypothetical protein
MKISRGDDYTLMGAASMSGVKKQQGQAALLAPGNGAPRRNALYVSKRRCWRPTVPARAPVLYRDNASFLETGSATQEKTGG